MPLGMLNVVTPGFNLGMDKSPELMFNAVRHGPCMNLDYSANDYTQSKSHPKL